MYRRVGACGATKANCCAATHGRGKWVTPVKIKFGWDYFKIMFKKVKNKKIAVTNGSDDVQGRRAMGKGGAVACR